MTTAANAMTTDAMNVITLGAERSSIVPPFKARPVGLKVSLAFPSPRGDHHSRVGFGRASYLMAERAAAFRSVQATPIRVLERQTTRWGLWLPSIQISKSEGIPTIVANTKRAPLEDTFRIVHEITDRRLTG
jgi:hypothetical protein